MHSKSMTSGWPYFGALIALVFLWGFSEQQLNRISKSNIERNLATVLEATHDSVRTWTASQKANANSIIQLPEIREASLALLAAPTEGDRRKLREQLREKLGPLITSHGYLGYSVITPSGLRVGSLRVEERGSINFIARTVPEQFEQVLSGASALTLPIHSDVPLIDPSGQERSKVATMFVMAPIRSLTGNVVGVLALRINPLQEFSSIFSHGRPGVSGETYGFDHEGNMLTESRFTAKLREIGLLAAGEVSTLNVEIKYPGRNLLEQRGVFGRQSWPLTKMAASATKGFSDRSLDPYPDYRGVPVLGVWLWDESLAFGITTEIDADEAFESLTISKLAVRFFVFVVFVLLVALFLLQQKSHRVADQQRQALNAAKEKAEAANRAKMEFLSAMSHDLRTPLNAVIGFSQLLAEGLAKKEDYKTYLGYIVRSGVHLLNQLNEVLEFAKLDIGELSFSIVKCPAKTIIEDSVAMVQQLAETNKIELHIDSDLEGLPLVWADSTRACQVLVNFLANAIKYNRLEGKVYVTVNSEGEHLQFAVRDTGAGIPKQKMKSLWEPFNRVGAEKTAIEGSGIGLAFAKALVEGLSGRIGAESTEGVGSCFWFTLPIAQETKAPTTETHTVSDDELNGLKKAMEGKRVLLIEGAELDRLIVEKMLKHIDQMEVMGVETGKQGLEALRSNEFDMIIVGLRLPDMDGATWNQRRDQMGLAFGVPVVMISADITRETQQKMLVSGIVGIVEKPVIMEQLITILVDATVKANESAPTAKAVAPLPSG